MELNFELKTFDQLTVYRLYELLKLRQSIFIVEQNCPYLDCDGKDIYAHHLLGLSETNELIAYLRILPQGISYDEVSIGRVTTAFQYRKYGFGKKLMEEALINIKKLYGEVPVRIGAQSYLLDFYQSFGFEKLEPYMEDGIPHHIMLRK